MKIIPSLFIIFLLSGCVALSNLGKPKPKLDQLQLQESIQRFYSRFTERIIEGLKDHDHLKEIQSSNLLNEYLLYDSESLKIATSPYPEVNLLDMLVFIKLNKAVIRRYWIPKVYGEEGIGLYEAFRKSEVDINQIALQIMSKEQLISINDGIRRWLQENPDAYRVEKIRIADFSSFAKTPDGGGFSFSISQIFVDTKSAVKAVDQVSLVGNRALFLAQHMPLILRLHARIGSNEILTDSINSLQGAPGKINETINATAPLLENMVVLARSADKVVKDLKDILPDKNSPNKGGFNRSVAQLNTLVGNGTNLIEGLSEVSPKNFKQHYQDFIIFTATALVVAATAISFVWWGGYYISKRLLNSSKKEIT